MGRENNDPIVTQSSIALLQERFRQLQRVKEMREERELSKILVGSTKQLNPSTNWQYDQRSVAASNKLLFHTELIFQPRSPPHICLSLWPNSQRKEADFQCDHHHEAPVLMSLPPKGSLDYSMRALFDHKFDDSEADDDDIDTSLHL